MAALTGDLSFIAENVLTAGCDIVLHCNGNLREMKKIVKKNQVLGVKTKKRVEEFLINLIKLKKQTKDIDYITALNSFDRAFSKYL